ncbi:MAG: TatD family hydrolase [Bacteroidales bacterium]|nr:TatD family hydrolase [Bacteroidales bacterium]
MEFIDTHSHITDEAFGDGQQEYISRANAAGVTIMLQADISSAERPAMLDAVSRFPDSLRAMAGLYPGNVGADYRDELDLAIEASGRPGIVAIGEIGLDYHYNTDFKKEQKEVFKAQLELAAKLNLPVNIHLREATEDFFDVLDSCRGLALRGNLHAFSGSLETFRRVCRYGEWYVGIGGVVTFKNAGIARDLQDIPLERMVLETDAPYLAPTPLRGTRNESANIPVIAAKVAQIKNVTIEEVASATTANAKRLFSL